MNLGHELLDEYINKEYPNKVYGDLTLENILRIYDSMEYKVYVLKIATKNLIDTLLRK